MIPQRDEDIGLLVENKGNVYMPLPMIFGESFVVESPRESDQACQDCNRIGK